MLFWEILIQANKRGIWDEIFLVIFVHKEIFDYVIGLFKYIFKSRSNIFKWCSYFYIVFIYIPDFTEFYQGSQKFKHFQSIAYFSNGFLQSHLNILNFQGNVEFNSIEFESCFQEVPPEYTKKLLNEEIHETSKEDVNEKVDSLQNINILRMQASQNGQKY